MRRADSLEKTLMMGKTEGRKRRWWQSIRWGWMASPTQWSWVWANSGRLWRIGKPGVLQSMGSQRVGHDWVTEQVTAMCVLFCPTFLNGSLCLGCLISLYSGFVGCAWLVSQLCPTLYNFMNYNLPGSSVHWDSPSKNTGVGCHALLQGIFPTQGSNPGLPPFNRFSTTWATREAPVRSLGALKFTCRQKSPTSSWRGLGLVSRSARGGSRGMLLWSRGSSHFFGK